MAANDQLETRRHGRGVGAHDKASANAEPIGDGKSHRRGGLAGRDQVPVAAARVAVSAVEPRFTGESVFDKLPRVDGSDTGPDNGQEILSKENVSAGQCEFL